ncbi:MAG: S1/P1 nuclease [Casimicrobiaceae bacterium]
MLVSGNAQAWGQQGHSIVAEIAQRRLSPVAAAKIQALLGNNASLASIASWADDARELRPETRRWHFVNVPLADSTYDPATQCVLDPKAGDCILNELERATATLGDLRRDRSSRSESLKFIVHLVADLHQPLHTVLEDQGGNFFPVRFFTDPTGRFAVETQLHKVWDDGLIGYHYWNWGAYVAYLDGTWLPSHQEIELATGKPVDWMLESHRVAAQVAYAGLTRGMQLDAAYASRVKPSLDRQLAAAGVRLAMTLNSILQ